MCRCRLCPPTAATECSSTATDTACTPAVHLPRNAGSAGRSKLRQPGTRSAFSLLVVAHFAPQFQSKRAAKCGRGLSERNSCESLREIHLKQQATSISRKIAKFDVTFLLVKALRLYELRLCHTAMTEASALIQPDYIFALIIGHKFVGADGFGSDDMWLDFFPGLLTQSNAS